VALLLPLHDGEPYSCIFLHVYIFKNAAVCICYKYWLHAIYVINILRSAHYVVVFPFHCHKMRSNCFIHSNVLDCSVSVGRLNWVLLELVSFRLSQYSRYVRHTLLVVVFKPKLLATCRVTSVKSAKGSNRTCSSVDRCRYWFDYQFSDSGMITNSILVKFKYLATGIFLGLLVPWEVMTCDNEGHSSTYNILSLLKKYSRQLNICIILHLYSVAWLFVNCDTECWECCFVSLAITVKHPHVVGAQLCWLSPVDAHTVTLKPVPEKITKHYSRYCALVFCYMHKCELCFISPGHRLKLYRI